MFYAFWMKNKYQIGLDWKCSWGTSAVAVSHPGFFSMNFLFKKDSQSRSRLRALAATDGQTHKGKEQKVGEEVTREN